MMHAFSLTIGSILGHFFARSLIRSAQQVVTYFRSSNLALAALAKEAANLRINAKPITSNTTRFTSVHESLVSILKMEQAYKAVLATSVDRVTNQEVLLITRTGRVECADPDPKKI